MPRRSRFAPLSAVVAGAALVAAVCSAWAATGRNGAACAPPFGPASYAQRVAVSDGGPLSLLPATVPADVVQLISPGEIPGRHAQDVRVLA
jgi:hypothetical protein